MHHANACACARAEALLYPGHHHVPPTGWDVGIYIERSVCGRCPRDWLPADAMLTSALNGQLQLEDLTGLQHRTTVCMPCQMSAWSGGGTSKRSEDRLCLASLPNSHQPDRPSATCWKRSSRSSMITNPELHSLEEQLDMVPQRTPLTLLVFKIMPEWLDSDQ